MTARAEVPARRARERLLGLVSLNHHELAAFILPPTTPRPPQPVRPPLLWLHPPNAG